MKTLIAIAVAGLAVAGCGVMDKDEAAKRAIFDRIAVEDLIVKYYEDLGAGKAAGIGDYYTEDAVFDVNGFVNKGHKEIEKLYSGMGNASSPLSKGTFHVLLGNPQIRVDGDTATARFVWTGVLNDNPFGPPRLLEQGREYDLLVRQGGKWLIKKRVVIADSGVPESFREHYDPRKDYDITK